MNNKPKTSKTAVAGVAAVAAGLIGTAMMVNQPAAETQDSTTVAALQPASEARIAKVEWQLNRADAHHYSGPRTADAADAWLESRQPYTGPRTADAAKAWLESETAPTGPTTSAPVGPDTDHSGYTRLCPVTSDTALHWIRATGHLPCEP
jgi:hypothetical protein